MSKSPRALQELMTAVDAGQAVDVTVDSASSDVSKLLGPRRRRSTNYGRGAGGVRKGGAPAVAVGETSSDASFEFSAVVSYSAASPASMVFSDGQLRAHQFPAVGGLPPVSVRSSAGSSQATSPLRSSSVASSSSTKQQQAGVTTGSKKRVSFATDGADDKAAAAKAVQGKKSGGLLGCMASACGTSSRNEAVEPAARNANRKVVAV